MALTTKSASGWVETLTEPSEPCSTSMSLPSPAFLILSWSCPADSTEPIDINWGRQRRACSKASSTLLPAAMATMEKRSGKLSTMLSVLLPMEPVEPRMAMRFMQVEERAFRPAFSLLLISCHPDRRLQPERRDLLFTAAYCLSYALVWPSPRDKANGPGSS